MVLSDFDRGLFLPVSASSAFRLLSFFGAASGCGCFCCTGSCAACHHGSCCACRSSSLACHHDSCFACRSSSLVFSSISFPCLDRMRFAFSKSVSQEKLCKGACGCATSPWLLDAADPLLFLQGACAILSANSSASSSSLIAAVISCAGGESHRCLSSSCSFRGGVFGIANRCCDDGGVVFGGGSFCVDAVAV